MMTHSSIRRARGSLQEARVEGACDGPGTAPDGLRGEQSTSRNQSPSRSANAFRDVTGATSAESRALRPLRPYCAHHAVHTDGRSRRYESPLAVQNGAEDPRRSRCTSSPPPGKAAWALRAVGCGIGSLRPTLRDTGRSFRRSELADSPFRIPQTQPPRPDSPTLSCVDGILDITRLRLLRVHVTNVTRCSTEDAFIGILAVARGQRCALNKAEGAPGVGQSFRTKEQCVV